MPLQDLTPQLRTRLSRLERVVGLFVSFAVLLMVAGLAFYLHRQAKSRGWFLLKLPYFTFPVHLPGEFRQLCFGADHSLQHTIKIKHLHRLA